MGQFWTKLVVIVHKIARFRTRKPNNTLSALKSIHRKNNNFGWSDAGHDQNINQGCD